MSTKTSIKSLQKPTKSLQKVKSLQTVYKTIQNLRKKLSLYILSLKPCLILTKFSQFLKRRINPKISHSNLKNKNRIKWKQNKVTLLDLQSEGSTIIFYTIVSIWFVSPNFPSRLKRPSITHLELILHSIYAQFVEVWRMQDEHIFLLNYINLVSHYQIKIV